MRLEGRRALVTGSDQGIGRAILLAFAREGADVVIHHRHSPTEAEKVRSEAEEAGRRAAVVQADLGEAGAAQKLFDASVAKLGGLDILVNNAGMEQRAPFLEITEKDYRTVIEVDLSAPFFLAQAFVRHCAKPVVQERSSTSARYMKSFPFPISRRIAWPREV